MTSSIQSPVASGTAPLQPHNTADKIRLQSSCLRTSAFFSAVTVLSLVLTGHANAQTPAAMDQVHTAQQRRALEQSGESYHTGDTVPEIYPGESDDVGPQSVLALQRRHTLFEGIADAQYFYTDNVFLDHSTRVPSGVLVSTAQFALAPSPYKLAGGELSPRLGFREQWFDFFEYRSFTPSLKAYDFNAQTAFVDEHWTWHRNWILGLGFDYTRLLTTSSYHQFYSEYVPRWDASYVMPLGQKEALSLSYQGFYHFTDASQFIILPQNSLFDRLDQVLMASFTWAPCEHFMLQPYYAFRYTHFTKSVERDDYLNSVGVGAYYFFNRYMSARLFTNFDHRDSNITQAEYHQFAAGAGANVTVRF